MYPFVYKVPNSKRIQLCYNVVTSKFLIYPLYKWVDLFWSTERPPSNLFAAAAAYEFNYVRYFWE